MPLSYKIVPNLDIPLMANDLYYLIRAHDYAGIEALIHQEPEYLNAPVTYLHGLAINIFTYIIEENDLELTRTFIRLQAPQLAALETMTIAQLDVLTCLNGENCYELLTNSANQDAMRSVETLKTVLAFIQKIQKNILAYLYCCKMTPHCLC